MWDVEGNQYLDFFGGVLTTMIGHNNPAVTEAIQSQASKVLHTSTLYLSEPMIELAEEIGAASGIPNARVPSQHQVVKQMTQPLCSLQATETPMRS